MPGPAAGDDPGRAANGRAGGAQDAGMIGAGEQVGMRGDEAGNRVIGDVIWRVNDSLHEFYLRYLADANWILASYLTHYCRRLICLA